MIMLKRWCLLPVAAAMFILASCDDSPKEWKTPNMTTLSPRLKPVFEKTKTICFGRFMVDVPASATVAWGDSSPLLSTNIYPDGVIEVEKLASKFVDDLKEGKAIYHDDVPLLLSIDHVVLPEGRIITGYDGHQAINDLKINGYFKLNNDGVVIDTRTLRDDKDETITEILSAVRRLKRRGEDEIPTDPGNCIEYGFLHDRPNPTKDDFLEHIRIGFRLKEFPDAHLSIYVAPSNPHNPEGDSLEAQWKRIIADANTDDDKIIEKTKFFRQSARQIHEWQTGYEVLLRSPDENSSHGYHDFQAKFTGVPGDGLKPYADIQFQTGVTDNAAGATKPSLTDEEAIAVWDKITSTIRVRPTGAAAVKSAAAAPQPRLPLGELAATGRTCLQSGLWESSEPSAEEGGQRRYVKAGDIMPRVTARGEASLWQKLKGEKPIYTLATVWKLIDYDDVPALAGVATQAPSIAQILPEEGSAKHAAGNQTGDRPSDAAPPKERG